jgi:protein associated with RNAse G/E
MTTIRINQDGNYFYNSQTGVLIYISPIKITDFDMDAAIKARKDFQDFAQRTELEYKLVR